MSTGLIIAIVVADDELMADDDQGRTADRYGNGTPAGDPEFVGERGRDR
jgi:hypothetical protein